MDRKKARKSNHITALNTPPPPQYLVEALHDSIHEQEGHLIKTTSLKHQTRTGVCVPYVPTPEPEGLLKDIKAKVKTIFSQYCTDDACGFYRLPGGCANFQNCMKADIFTGEIMDIFKDELKKRFRVENK